MQPNRFRDAILPLTAVITSACATTHLARPVGRGNTRVSLTAGGPIAQLYGAPIPAPVTVVGIAHGVRDDLDVHAELHPFAAALDTGQGAIPVLGLTVGGAYHPIASARRALTIGTDVYGFTNKLDAEVIADFWFSGGVAPTSWLSLAIGMHNAIRVGTTDTTLSQRDPWIPILFAQAAVTPFSGRLTIDLEFRWYAIYENGVNVIPTFYTVGNYGALGFLLGFHFQMPRGTP